MNFTEQREKLCLPLDSLPSLAAVQERIEELSPYVGWFKIGKGTFTRFGPDVVHLVQRYQKKVFLDLKFHDIPATVRDAALAASSLGVDMITVHAAGGKAMMAAAREGAGTGVKIVAVTLLTSLSQEQLSEELHVRETVKDYVLHLAELAREAGLNGIVCSAQELAEIRPFLRSDFFVVTPGITGQNRLTDQQRTTSPREALQAGASLLVVGRAITEAVDRKKAALEILHDMAD